MAWSNISTADVLAEFTQLEAAVIQNQIGPGAQGSLGAVLGRTIAEARGMIKAGGNQVDQSAATVPDQVAQAVIALARWRWIISLPALKTMQTQARQAAAEEAQKRLAGIASQDPKRERTELPTTTDGSVSTEQQPTASCPKPRLFGPRAEEGIV